MSYPRSFETELNWTLTQLLNRIAAALLARNAGDLAGALEENVLVHQLLRRLIIEAHNRPKRLISLAAQKMAVGVDDGDDAKPN